MIMMLKRIFPNYGGGPEATSKDSVQPEQIMNVGKHVASVRLNDGHLITITRLGVSLGGSAWRDGLYDLMSDMEKTWIKADNGIWYNVATMQNCTIWREDYFVPRLK